MTKAEVYKMVIDMQVKSGQGCSGIVRLGNDPTVGTHLDELVEEGVIKACNTGGSIGHRYSNIFYMPVKGYNVWEDEDTNGWSSNLTFVRLYLDILPDMEANKLDVTRSMMIQDVNWMKRYSDWLEKNKEGLEIMVNLDNSYYESETKLTQKEIDYIKSRGWYKNNKTFKECLSASNGFISDRKELISINNKLIQLYEQKNDAVSISKCEKDIEDSENLIYERKRINKWLMSQDKDSSIQEVIDKVTTEV